MSLSQPAMLPGIFAASGDYQQIPATDAGNGRAAWDIGFPPETSLPKGAGGIPPRRIDFNGIANALSSHAYFQQSGALYAWNAALQYPAGAHVLGSDGKEYVALIDSGTSETVGAVNPVTDVNFTAWKPQDRIFADLIYPVGSIYMSAAAISPAVLFGGVWRQITGRFLLASSDKYPLGTTGGSETKQLTVQNLPAHNHGATLQTAGAHTHTATTSSNGAHTHTRGTMEITGYFNVELNGNSAAVGGAFTYGGDIAGKNSTPDGSIDQRVNFNASRTWTGATSSNGAHTHTLTTTSNGTHTHTVTIENTGGNQAFNIMPPFFAVNVWQRTA